MSKRAEEGRIWEWRGFGQVTPVLEAQIRRHPIRMGIANISGEDIYLVSPLNDQNVKLRASDDTWLLKFKILEATVGGIELYNESNSLTFNFPVERSSVEKAARLLQVELRPGRPGRSSDDEFIQAMCNGSPPTQMVRVKKIRSQFMFEGGWFELASAEFPAGQIQTVSIHSPSLETVETTLEQLNVEGVEAMNYVEACRRWAQMKG